MSAGISSRKKPFQHSTEIVTGRAAYTVDIELPDMLYAKFLRSPYAHARIKKIDLRKAKARPEVRAVLTYRDVPKVPFNSGDKIPFTPEVFVKDEFILDERVRFVGDKVAAVAATSLDAVDEALALIEVEYEKLPAVFDPEEAMKEGAPLVHGEKPGSNIVRHCVTDIGNIDEGFRKADHVFEDRYKVPIVDHCCMEPHSAVASYDPSKGLIVWTSTQNAFMFRAQIGRLFDLPLSMVRVIQPHVGGAFGSKQDLTVEPACVLLSMRTGRPVKMELSREEMFVSAPTGHSAVVDIKSGVSRDGMFVARQAKAVFNTGAYCSAGPAVTDYAGWAFTFAYKSPNIRFDGYTVYTTLPVAGAYRGYGPPQSNFAVESQIDRICDELGFDDIEFRIRNSPKIGDVDYSTGLPILSSQYEECLRRGAREFGWNERKKHTEKSGRTRRGIGMSSCKQATGNYPAMPEFATVRIEYNEDGTVHVNHGMSELGQGSNTVMAIVASEELGIPYESILVNPHVDTENSPWDRGTHASRGTMMIGNATMLAAREAKQRLLNHAGQMLGVPTHNLEIHQNKIFVKGSERSVSVSETVSYAMFVKNDPIYAEATYRPMSCPVTFGANFAEVEVDLDTGRVTVVRFLSVLDAGRIVSQLGCEGQIEGGVVMALGHALTEELQYDNSTGRVLNATFRDYKTMGPKDLPEIEYIFIEENDPTSILGSKGISEACMVSVVPAISNAIYNAMGIRLREAPFNPDRIIQARVHIK